ncbi:MAG: amino acid oxidase, partial [Lachnospiraceae bacterium]|nr:amino acid oxidase [Lachnospiraceae bacterium]
IGLTAMDGPFFSIMPFGKTGLHSLTSVAFTPHETCYEELAKFPCQEKTEGKCRPGFLCNCNECPAHPESAWDYMSKLAKKYMLDKYKFEYVKSLYSIKPILTASDVDDSRPTCIKVHSQSPTFVSVLSGKITTVYDLEEIL